METAEEAALRLSGDERLRLIEKLWDSLVEKRGDHLEVSPEIRAELDRRLAAHRRDPTETLSWTEVKRQVRGVG
ncbi:addiction module protein [Enhygromyxa salina]|uniref:addiction module protein n=1 Tax=Enhygromyxa salina TaxID=215803 RepID=UPI000D08A088|nr:addiction module protein [Enhygromyxa salina]